MKNVLIINGHEPYEFAKGEYNKAIFNAIESKLSERVKLTQTVINEGYEIEEEQKKFQEADLIIYQYPVYWFNMPALMKKYIDEVYAYGVFFGMGTPDMKYGFGNGMMNGKKYMFSITFNAPQEAFNDKNSFFEGLSLEQFLMPMHKTQEFCGMEALESFAAYNVIKEPNVERDVERVRKHIDEVVIPFLNQQ